LSVTTPYILHIKNKRPTTTNALSPYIMYIKSKSNQWTASTQTFTFACL